jgi:hypothetical protein
MIFASDVLRSFLHRQQIATLDELKQALGTTSTMTVFRKLKALGYRTSYSHRGKYYTLAEILRFDEQGLWSCRGVGFSRHGNLLATAQAFVEQVEAGLIASELEALLHVEVKEPLLHLYRQGRIARRDIAGVYVYLSRQPARQREQRLRREARPGEGELEESALRGVPSPELKAAIVLFYSLLDERQRRLYAGLEAHKVGHGGDRKIADFLGLDIHTVARGRRELLAGHIESQRVRRKGGGRKFAEKKSQA